MISPAPSREMMEDLGLTLVKIQSGDFESEVSEHDSGSPTVRKRPKNYLITYIIIIVLVG